MFKPTVPQCEVMFHPARFKVVVAGRRFGKTYLALMWLILQASKPPDERRGWRTCWYVAPTYRQAKEIAWKLLKRLIPRELVQRTNENELSVVLKNGNEVALKGADNYDGLRGVALSALVLDEFATMDPAAWTEVLRPALADMQGDFMAIGSPAGLNHFYNMFTHSEDKEKYPQWASFKYTTAEGGNVPLEEIESAQREMDPRTFRQEFLASFESLEGRIFQDFDRKIHVKHNLVLPDDVPVLVGMDFNVNPLTSVIGYKRLNELHIVHEILIPNGNTDLMADALKRSYPNRQIQVYPDPSGAARKTSAAAGITDHSILASYGFQVLSPRKAPPVKDKLNNMNAMIKSSDGSHRLFVHPRCTSVIRALEGLTYVPGTNVPDKSGGLDHIADALGYLISFEFPIILARVTSSELLM